MSSGDSRPFIVIGENIHCTRKVKRNGPRVKLGPDGKDHVVFADAAGKEALLPIPERITRSETFQSGNVAHVAAAVELGMHGSESERKLGEAYMGWLAGRQEKVGSQYLDVNVDEISPEIDRRNAAMAWAVELLCRLTRLPLSIDSSEVSTLRVGLETVKRGGGPRPMVNSASLERPEAVDLTREFGAVAIVMASSESGLPTGVDDRVDNLDRIVAKCRAAGVALSDMFADPLIYTISATPTVAIDVLEVIRRVRAKYPEIHIAGGHSNISFGLPQRRLLNAVWLWMAMEAGVDSGLIDPLTCHPDDVKRIDPESEAVKLARAGFLNEDAYFGEFIMAHRAGRLKSPFGAGA